MFYGRGAGGAPTASAVLGDLVAVARNRLTGGPRPQGVGVRKPARPFRWADTITRYHVSLDVADKAGVLAVVANTFASHDVSISSVRQEGRGDDASLVIVTHTATRRGTGRDRGRGARPRRRPGRFQRHESGGRDMTVTATARPSPARPNRDGPTAGPLDRFSCLARSHRGVPRSAAGDGRHPGHHPARGWHPPRSGRHLSDLTHAARSTSRSRAPTPPVRSRTAA